jgi:SSS family solute:Na+ symporter
MFMALMGALAGGGGAVIIGGLYWRRGTEAAAWGAMLTGAVLAAGGWILQQTRPDFPLNGQIMSFICWIAAIAVYVGISLVETFFLGRPQFEMDRMLHRGIYSVRRDGEIREVNQPPLRRWRQMIDMGREFSSWDKVVYLGTILWAAGYLVCFLVGSFFGLTRSTSDDSWASFWYVFIMVYTVLGVVTTIWFLIGGGRDIFNMLRRLNAATLDSADDGSVVGHQSRADLQLTQANISLTDLNSLADSAADSATAEDPSLAKKGL